MNGQSKKRKSDEANRASNFPHQRGANKYMDKFIIALLSKNRKENL